MKTKKGKAGAGKAAKRSYKYRVGSVVTVRKVKMEVVGAPDGAGEYWVKRNGVVFTYDAAVFDRIAKLIKA